MKGRVLLIAQDDNDRSHAALLIDGKIEDLLIDPPASSWLPAPGDMLMAIIDRPAPGQGAMFARWRDGDLTLYVKSLQGLGPGDAVLVQVTAYPESGKAVPCTDRAIFKGRNVIFTPSVTGINVSRKIKNPDERARLKTSLKGIRETGGFILRSASFGVADDELQFEATTLVDWFSSVSSGNFGQMRGVFFTPAMIAEREWTDPQPDEILYEGDIGPVYEELEPLARDADFDLFDHYGVWDEIERLKSPRVDLPSGAWMAVEATRAMVTVDVNTAGEFGGGAALTANLQAAKELPRQLRLRGLGGQVIIDFAPLKKTDRKRVEEALKAAFRKDPIDTTLAGWTPLGNFELQRKRERRPLTELLG